MSKLPNDICLEIARKAKGDVWKIDDLFNTIKLEIEAREVSEGHLINNRVKDRGSAYRRSIHCEGQ